MKRAASGLSIVAPRSDTAAKLRSGRGVAFAPACHYDIDVSSIRQERMDATSFREVMDALGLNATEVAELFGLAPQTVRQMRLDPEHVNYRRPPPDWREKFAPIARRRGGKMLKLADQLERGAS